MRSQMLSVSPPDFEEQQKAEILALNFGLESVETLTHVWVHKNTSGLKKETKKSSKTDIMILKECGGHNLHVYCGTV